MPNYLSVADAIDLWKVSRRTVVAGCKLGMWGAKKIGGRWIITDPPLVNKSVSTRDMSSWLKCTDRYARKLSRICTTARRIKGQIRVDLMEALLLVGAREYSHSIPEMTHKIWNGLNGNNVQGQYPTKGPYWSDGDRGGSDEPEPIGQKGTPNIDY